MNKNLTLSFNHKAEYIQHAILVNGEPVLSPKNIPTLEKFSKTALMLLGAADSKFSVENLAKVLANTKEDGIELAVSAVTCGDILTEISPKCRTQGMLLLTTHLLGGQPISEIIEETQTVVMALYLNNEEIDHNEMYTITTLSSLIVFGMIMAIQNKIFTRE